MNTHRSGTCTLVYCDFVIMTQNNRGIYREEIILRKLRNRPKFSMIYTPIDHRNDLIKCSKLKWNHESQASGFLQSFEHFMASFLWSIRV